MIKKSIKELDYSEYASEKPIFDIDLSYIENKKIPRNIKYAVRKNINKINFYKYSQDRDLIELISHSVEIDKDYILLTSGCDGALKHISETFLEKNDKVIIPVPSFPRYEFHVKVMEAIPYFINFSNFPFEFDLNLMLKEFRKVKPKMIFIGNPNNPTGHFISKGKIERFLKKIDSVVVLDEALAEYTGDSCVGLVKKYPNLIVTRSFSKLYGLAGLRIGYLIVHPDLKKQIAKTISPFELTVLAIEAAKKALANNKKFVEDTIKETRRGIQYIKKNLKLPSSNSSSSAILICDGNVDLYNFLLREGILVVSGKHFRGLENNNCIRVSVSSINYLKKLLEKLNSLTR